MISAKEFSKKCDFIACPRYVGDSIQVPKETPKRVFITGENGIFESCIYTLKNFKEKYDLVYHCTDRTFDRFDFECIRPYVNHIWAQNCEITHPMITKIPIGFSDSYIDNIPKRTDTKKDILCYLNVGIPNTYEHKFIRYHSLRTDCVNHFKSKTWCTVESNVPQEEFNNKLQRSKFVICPMGFGIDTHRFFETVWLNCTPIVISSGLDSLYKKYNALIVDSWDDVTEELLNNHEHKRVPDEMFDVDYFIK
jgi:hypothetical protein